MAKKLQFPVAKIRSDGVPAIWLTHTNWLVLRESLISQYCHQRERAGARMAREAMGKQIPDLDCWHFEVGAAEAALGMYRAGYEAYRDVSERCQIELVTPGKLVELGDRSQARGFDEETIKLAAKEGKR